MRKPAFAYAKTKTQISFAVTAKLISAFVFATLIVQSLYFINTTFQASSYLLWLYSLVCVGPGRKPRRPVFSQRGSNAVTILPKTHYRIRVLFKPQFYTSDSKFSRFYDKCDIEEVTERGIYEFSMTLAQSPQMQTICYMNVMFLFYMLSLVGPGRRLLSCLCDK